MTHTSALPATSDASAESLRARVPGWGVDLDPADRPAVPRETVPRSQGRDQPELPVRQVEKWPRERSIEHARLTPVFGTAAPPRGLSGLLRRRAYARYSEARAAHWLLLLGADRVDAFGSHLRSFATLRPDNPLTETGVRTELTHHGITSRVGQQRADVIHHALDPIIVAGPWVAGAALAGAVVRRLRRRRRRHSARAAA